MSTLVVQIYLVSGNQYHVATAVESPRQYGRRGRPRKPQTEVTLFPLDLIDCRRFEPYHSTVRPNFQFMFNTYTSPFTFCLDWVDDSLRSICATEISLYIMWIENGKVHEDFHYIEGHVPPEAESSLMNDLQELVASTASLYQNDFGFNLNITTNVWFTKEPQGIKQLTEEPKREGVRVFVHRPQQLPSIFSHNNIHMIPCAMTIG